MATDTEAHDGRMEDSREGKFIKKIKRSRTKHGCQEGSWGMSNASGQDDMLLSSTEEF